MIIKKIMIILLISMLVGCDGEQRTTEFSTQRISDSEKMSVQEEKQKIACVYICGQVKHPGVYQVSTDGRINDVLKMAGGFTKKAQRDALNLAEPVSDGERIYVLSKKEAQKAEKADESAGETPGGSTVNLNSASQQELMTLPGIGASKAQAIIEYREKNGRFTKIEDLKKVSGIGDATFSNIESMIAIG